MFVILFCKMDSALTELETANFVDSFDIFSIYQNWVIHPTESLYHYLLTFELKNILHFALHEMKKLLF
jgi:hypothetical protein